MKLCADPLYHIAATCGMDRDIQREGLISHEQGTRFGLARSEGRGECRTRLVRCIVAGPNLRVPQRCNHIPSLALRAYIRSAWNSDGGHDLQARYRWYTHTCRVRGEAHLGATGLLLGHDGRPEVSEGRI